MLLTQYRVLDLTGPLGFMTGKIFGDLGADVIKIEPPGGDAARRLPPFLKNGNGSTQSLYWLAYNTNKRGITLNLQSEMGRELFCELAIQSDFIIESFHPGGFEALGLDYDSLRHRNPGLIRVSISPFGQAGPYKDLHASDLEIMALSGAMSLAGEKDGEPMRVSVPQAPMWVGAEAAMGALTALAYRSATGRGQQVDVSAQVAVMSALAHAPSFWDLNRVNPERAGVFVTGRSVLGAKMRVMWPCKDGWINFIIYGGAAGRHTNQQLVMWMSDKGLAPEWLKAIDWNTFTVTNITQEAVDRLETPIANFFATITKDEFLAGAIKRQMLGYPVATVADIDHNPQLQARTFWQQVPDPESGKTLKHPGGFAVINGERLQIRRGAPKIGEHNQEVYGQELGLNDSEIAELKATGVI
ncbi:MAG TPA: CaiB/BaiF CoA-transferase family protein [Pyrinomonadaceae bacterium]|nr:CaiB/BaiF CoA-transferase family protein [Pyrinomonadaceae bacterium]